MSSSLKRKLGAALIDWPQFERNLRGGAGPRGHWTRIGNRRDVIRVGPAGLGAECEGRWTSRLHGCEMFPSLGRRLMARALAEWPIGFADEPRPASISAAPDISFVIGHRGEERLPHLRLVLQSVAAQVDAAVECVVVEQSTQAGLAGRLPPWVRTLHTPAPDSMPYSRAWAFNVGARSARGRVVAFHDNDMLLPRRYAAELLARRVEGYEVSNLKRFVFYLGESATLRVLDGGPIEGPPAHVVQNLEGGGSVGVDREVFFASGGFDEAFVGWGGEDNEFWERSQVRAVWRWGYLPIVHLHHTDQPEKGRSGRLTATLLDVRTSIPPADRVRELTGRAFGRSDGPDPVFRPERSAR